MCHGEKDIEVEQSLILNKGELRKAELSERRRGWRKVHLELMRVLKTKGRGRKEEGKRRPQGPRGRAEGVEEVEKPS